MYLKRLDITGFKSFASRSTLDFEDGQAVTAIVGPNGSGKSNIADSIRWVLGEQSYKSIRSKKSEDVIFSGSNGKAKASMARVSLLLDNTNGRAPIDFTEVELSRTVFRDGSSEYLINGKKSRLLDVAELLAKSGFGQSTYTVIGQGMVDSMLFYGPAERKVLFDEAAGVRQYEIKREQTIKKLEDTAQNLVRSKDILSELEPRLNTLRRQAKRAEEKEAVRESLTEKQKIYFSTVWDRITLSEKEKRSDLEKLTAEEEKIKEEVKELNEKFTKVLSSEQKEGQEANAVRAKITELQTKKDQLRQEIFTLRAKIEVSFSADAMTKKEIAEKIENIKKELESGDSDESAEALEKIKKEEAEIATKIAGIQRSIEEKRADLSTLSKELTKFDFGVVGERLKDIMTNQNDFVSKLEVANSTREIKLLIPIGKQVAMKLKELSGEVGNVKEGRFPKMAEIQAELEKLTLEKEKATEQLNTLRSEAVQLQFRSQKQKEKKEDLTAEMARLEKIKPIEESQKGDFEKEIAGREKQIAELDKEIESLRLEINELSSGYQDQGKILTDIKDKLYSKQKLQSQYSSEIANLRVELARYETKKQDLHEEIIREMGSEASLATVKVVPELNEEAARAEIERLKTKLYAIGEIDPDVQEEFSEVSLRVEFLSGQLTDLDKAKTDLEKLISELDQKIKKQFEASFSAISAKFTHFFELLFDGGEAKLELVKTKDEEADEERFGIEITAVPPGKRVKSLSVLSGGERTLTSLALLFAILSVNPSPFCVLDEVDAALDETNTVRYLKIVKELSDKTQFIFITHNRETMKTASHIYGITMDESHSSKILSVRLEEAVKIEKKKVAS